MLVGTNLKFAKAYNARIVLETIRRFGPLSRADIARRTELTAQTVSNIMRPLLRAHLVREAERTREGRGAPATLLTLDPDGAYAIGLDLDKDHLTGVLVDFVGNVRQRMHTELNFPSPDEAFDLLETTARTLIEREGLTDDRVWGVGVGLPGLFGIARGSVVSNVVSPQAFPGWHDVPVAEVVSDRLGLPVLVKNNATAAAIGECWYGAGQHIPTFFYVFFGAGLGGGLIVNGQPYEGHTGNAGELGYCFLAESEMPDDDTTPQRPHLGLHFNLPRLYRRLGVDGPSDRHPRVLGERLAASDPLLIEWLDAGARQLAPVLLAIEYVLDPEAIFFGGRLPDTVLQALMDRLDVLLPTLRIEGKAATPALRIAIAGADAAALGVATLPLYASFAPAPRVLLKGRGADGAAPALGARPATARR